MKTLCLVISSFQKLDAEVVISPTKIHVEFPALQEKNIAKFFKKFIIFDAGWLVSIAATT